MYSSVRKNPTAKELVVESITTDLFLSIIIFGLILTFIFAFMEPKSIFFTIPILLLAGLLHVLAEDINIGGGIAIAGIAIALALYLGLRKNNLSFLREDEKIAHTLKEEG